MFFADFFGGFFLGGGEGSLLLPISLHCIQKADLFSKVNGLSPTKPKETFPDYVGK